MSSFSDDDFSIDLIDVNQSTEKNQRKKYNTSEELMFIKCKCSDTSDDKYTFIFDDGYTCQINNLFDRNLSDDIILYKVQKEVMNHYFNRRFVTHVMIHYDAQICLSDETLEPTYTFYVYYIPSKTTTIKGEHLRKDRKWIFSTGDKSLVIKYSPLHMSSCEGIVYGDLKDALKSWFPDREYFKFHINDDYQICVLDVEMPETYTIISLYID